MLMLHGAKINANEPKTLDCVYVFVSLRVLYVEHYHFYSKKRNFHDNYYIFTKFRIVQIFSRHK